MSTPEERSSWLVGVTAALDQASMDFRSDAGDFYPHLNAAGPWLARWLVTFGDAIGTDPAAELEDDAPGIRQAFQWAALIVDHATNDRAGLLKAFDGAINPPPEE